METPNQEKEEIIDFKVMPGADDSETGQVFAYGVTSGDRQTDILLDEVMGGGDEEWRFFNVNLNMGRTGEICKKRC